MKVEVSTAIEELKRQFCTATVTAREDGQGGAYVVIEPVELSTKFRPPSTWVGFQVPATYPYADIYPVFIGTDLQRADGVAFQAPVTLGHTFEGKGAIQISRRSAAAQSGSQKAVAKILKVLDYLENLQ
jgi:hypothetical protein